ncbi:hypothetical protein L1887_40481 [Cichorium endivia]|nr:hypothetical protein L1887_40481 [Cichorium endivia]
MLAASSITRLEKSFFRCFLDFVLQSRWPAAVFFLSLQSFFAPPTALRWEGQKRQSQARLSLLPPAPPPSRTSSRPQHGHPVARGSAPSSLPNAHHFRLAVSFAQKEGRDN